MQSNCPLFGLNSSKEAGAIIVKTFGQLQEKYDVNASYKERQRQASHGPLMKAGDWIGKRKLKDFVDHPEINDGHKASIAVAELHHPYDGNVKPKKVALLSSGHMTKDDLNSGYNNKGYNVHHQWYEDTGLGHKFPSSTLVVKGHIHIHPDGSHTKHGDVSDADMNTSHNLMVYK